MIIHVTAVDLNALNRKSKFAEKSFKHLLGTFIAP